MAARAVFANGLRVGSGTVRLREKVIRIEKGGATKLIPSDSVLYRLGFSLDDP